MRSSCSGGLILWLTYWSCVVPYMTGKIHSYTPALEKLAGQPVDDDPNTSQAEPTEAWLIFNKFLRDYLSKAVVESFEQVSKPDKDGFREHALNDRTAKHVSQETLRLLRIPFQIDVAVLVWDAVLPSGYKDWLTRRVAVVEYDQCLHPPDNVLGADAQIMMKPCKEGGSVYTFARSAKFGVWQDDPDLKRREQKIKRLMLFYTPHDVWSLAIFPDNAVPNGKTSSDLAEGFKDAMKSCLPTLKAHRTPGRVSPAAYASCIAKRFDEKVKFDGHTQLRGLAILPEIMIEITKYSAPGRSSPSGHVYEILFDVPSFVRQHLEGDMKFWLFAHIPVVVSSLDCHDMLWEGC